MTAMSPASSMLDAALTEALTHEKSLFLARNTSRCRHLLVRFRAEHEHDRLVVTAAFTLDEGRRWHQSDAFVALRPPVGEESYEQRVQVAFGQLEDGMETARIAR